MAESSNPGGSVDTKGLKEDAIVARLAPDAGSPADGVALVGFLGKSPSPGSWRLYRTPRLNDYFEITEDDIIRSQSLATPEDPLGGTMLWVRKRTTLQRTQVESTQVQAEFLQGDLTGDFLLKAGSLGSEEAFLAERRRTHRCLTWGCCPWDSKVAGEMSDAGTRFLEGDIIGLFLTEALAPGEGIAMRNHRTHYCLTFGCCPEGGVSRRSCQIG